MPNTKTRIVGSGFTTLNYRGQAIAFLQSFTDGGQSPIPPQPEPVYVLGQNHATEIATGRAISAGQLTLVIKELWNTPVWEQLAGLAGTQNIIDVYQALAADPSEVTCQMLIKPPGLNIWRGKIYHNCTVAAIDDGEEVAIGTLTVNRSIAVWYTHTNRFTMAAGQVATTP